MTDTTLTCPKCGHAIPLSEALTAQLSNQLEARLRQEYEARVRAALKRKQQELDLELERRLAAARTEDEKRLRDLIGQEQFMELAKRDKQTDDMKKAIDDLQRKSQQGSRELQGEVLELDTMEKIWKDRKKQIERVIANTVGMYGEMSGIPGGGLPEIPALSQDGVAGLLEP